MSESARRLITNVGSADARLVAPPSTFKNELMAVVASLSKAKPGDSLETATKKLSKRGLEVLDLHVAVRWFGGERTYAPVKPEDIITRLGYKPDARSVTQALNLGFIRHTDEGYI